MSVGITVDLGSATAPYEQIRSQIASLVALGELTPATKLPSVRSLASDLGIAAGTVARAYKELEAAGVVQSRRRGGTVVATRPPGPAGHAAAGSHGEGAATPAAADLAEVRVAVDRYIKLGRRAGLADEVLVDLVRGRLRQDGPAAGRLGT